MTLTDHLIHLENGRLAADAPRSAVEAVAHKAAAHGGPGGIVLHFHGGLVSHQSGLEIAARLLPVYRQAGAYPVFFVWESGLVETVRNT